MASISDTIVSVDRLKVGPRSIGGTGKTSGLVPLAAFGHNPGNLRALLHVPVDLRPGAPLVVVLHGCTQTAVAYDHGSGWSTLADRFGFAVLYPEQQRANNPNLCFNWFSPEDTRRGGGEAESVREMLTAAIERHALDRSRVFVTGLSAGGAMTSTMLATYPELFAGGAIIAGLPYGTATGVPEALERMRGNGHDRAMLSAHVRDASAHRGPWPAVSVWHGTADLTVSATNAAMIVDQWRGVHGVGAPDATGRIDGHVHRMWHDVAGRVVIEEYAIAGLGHGTPIAISGDEACGVPGAHMLNAGISSTYRIAASWSIVPASAPTRKVSPADGPRTTAAGREAMTLAPVDPGRVINDALRAAGLMRS
ncbi:extracellular catalytic domain type 1 short-chain-length polyhydroxyalkanoate depolymerase [Sphingomonas bacterium]|uniref:extracellular catalytic domain type 1 short-chain-length polyhydroxyalkanoate depolymerase n=1 Tax=Sphingomonas bacterium TaxID=1895847 RepID=UPI0020C6DDCC|nr:PHB depolymerase family esterase [Sphingomonas bacterium]